MLSKSIRPEGFTLIEVMIVIAIIGILAAIAIPQYSAYRTRSFNASALSDIRNATTAQEAYYAENREYASSLINLQGPYGFTTSKGVILTISADTNSYTVTSYHPSGNKSYTMNGSGGAIISN